MSPLPVVNLMLELAPQTFNVYEGNIAAGWYTDTKTGESLVGKRDVEEMFALIMSELGEALEGFRKHSWDTHLPQYPMIVVEFADVFVRVFDLIGNLGYSLEGGRYNNTRFDPTGNLASEINRMNMDLCKACTAWMEGNQVVVELRLFELLDRIYSVYSHYGPARDWPSLEEVYNVKRTYNSERADHKLETRRAPGGKSI